MVKWSEGEKNASVNCILLIQPKVICLDSRENDDFVS